MSRSRYTLRKHLRGPKFTSLTADWALGKQEVEQGRVIDDLMNTEVFQLQPIYKSRMCFFILFCDSGNIKEMSIPWLSTKMTGGDLSNYTK